MKARFIRPGLATLLLTAVLPAQDVLAHHSIAAEFDTEGQVAFTGKVTEVEWFNPHIWIDLEVTGQDGKVATWQCEMGAPNRLLRNGWRKEDLPLGTVVNVSGNPARDGSNTCNARRVTMTDGRIVFQGDNAKEISP